MVSKSTSFTLSMVFVCCVWTILQGLHTLDGKFLFTSQDFLSYKVYVTSETEDAESSDSTSAIQSKKSNLYSADVIPWKPRIQFRTLTNYTPDQGFDPVDPLIMDNTNGRMTNFLRYYGIDPSQPIIYFITPTYRRTTQMVDMVRLAQTLRHDLAIYWIVIEDATECSKRIRDLLDRTGLLYAHIAVPTKPTKRRKNHRGVAQRNTALDIVDELSQDFPGVVYFGDDDNAYDYRLFDEIRKTTTVGIFSVGFVSRGMYARCHVNPETGKVDGVVSRVKYGRRYPMDMGGFCVHTSRVRGFRFLSRWHAGFLETNFLAQVVESYDDFEPLAENCTRIYVWHVKTDGHINTTVASDPISDQIEPLV